MGANWTGAMGANWYGANWFGANWTGGGGGGVPVFAMRADAPLAEQTITPHYTAKFQDRDWDADFVAQLILPEFLATNWKAGITVPPPTYPVTPAMINRLLLLAVTERPEALGEILQQHQNFQLCWMQLLNMDAGSHPQTFLLMKLAARVGEFVMVALKHDTQNKDQPRPSQVCPTLYPPVRVPGHSSYPAGHAMVASLTSACLKELLPVHADALDRLAERVAFNRLIAGLHYEEDNTVGAQIGRDLLQFIKLCPSYSLTFSKATAEWP
jgi:acid phosphatase (class A)